MKELDSADGDKVPEDGVYRVEVYGARGGSGFQSSDASANVGGQGAFAWGYFAFSKV